MSPLKRAENSAIRSDHQKNSNNIPENSGVPINVETKEDYCMSISAILSSGRTGVEASSRARIKVSRNDD